MVHVLLFTYGNLYAYGANNPVRYVDPDGREEYDSSITRNQYDEIKFKLYLQNINADDFNVVDWGDVQNFFTANPNGCIYRNPDEICYSFYEDRKKINEYNMYSTNMVDIFFIGKGLSKVIGKSLLTIGKTTLSKNLQHHIITRHTLNGLKSQVGKAPIEKLLKKTVFNPRWSEKKVLKASEKAINEAVKYCVQNGIYSTNIYGENVTVVMKNGIVDTVYGTIKVTEEMLSK